MKITYRLTFEDYYEAWLEHDAKNRRIRQSIAVLISALFCFAGRRTADARAGRVLIMLGVVSIVSVPAGGWLHRLNFKRAHGKDDSREFTVEVSEDRIMRVDARTTEGWSYFSNYSESKNDFVLYHAGMIHAIVPKRAFDDGGIAFRRILKANLRLL